MTHADRLRRTPTTCRRLTGLTPAAFRRSLGEAAAADQHARPRRADHPGRQRKAGGGRTPALPLADRLLMPLVCHRTYAPRTAPGVLSGPDDSNVRRGNRRPGPLPAGVVRIPARKVALTPEEIRGLFLDGAARPTDRPVRGQKRSYSGRTTRHTLETRVVVARVRKRPGRGPHRRRVRTVAVSPTFPGSMRDNKAYDRAGVAIPPGVTGCGGTAYIGTGLDTPRRKPRKGPPTPRQEAGGRRVSRRRIAVEHGIGKMTAWRAAAERWRTPRRRHALMTKNVAGLHTRMFAE